MKDIPYDQLRQKLLELPKSKNPITIERLGVIMDEEKFIKTHIAVVDSYPRKENPTIREKQGRFFIALPHYKRLLAYYFIKTQLQGAF